MDTLAEKLELHYFFDDDSHSMDAVIRNRCEAELLGLIKDVADELGFVVLELESEAYAEGGLIDRIKILAKKNPVISSIFIAVLVNVISNQVTTDRELVSLQKEALKLQIAQMKKEIDESNSVTSPIQDVDSSATAIVRSKSILKKRSNFYNLLTRCRKVMSIEWNGVDAGNKPVETPIPVVRVDFERYIINQGELEPLIDEDAMIEVISPVLRSVKKNYQWMGLYKGERVMFTMKDSNFRKQVVDGKVPFINGTCIDCVLTISRKLDEQGVEKITGYSVNVVTRVHDEEISTETPQGKKYRQKQEYEKKALKFSFADNEPSQASDNT